ncbi:hypothetical protein [Massilia sp. TSP1-1-2]
MVRARLPAGARAAQFIDALDGTGAAPRDGYLTLSIPALFGTVMTSKAPF